MSDRIQQSDPASFRDVSVRIGQVAPDFVARTTQGDLQLSALRGHWVMLFSHPADFTPVCTSEFIAFAQAEAEFKALNCALIGLSVDSLQSHLAWVEAIRAQFGVAIPFPIIEDPSMAIARAYGMLESGAQSSVTVRTVYILDPQGVVQAIMCYPHTVGRSVKELLRAVAALQRAAQDGVLLPEGWHPGDDVISPVALTQKAVTEVGPAWFMPVPKERQQ